jgi:hypothetical protein
MKMENAGKCKLRARVRPPICRSFQLARSAKHAADLALCKIISDSVGHHTLPLASVLISQKSQFSELPIKPVTT